MLVVRELEREVKELNKFQKDGLRVAKKTIQTRLDRAEAIKDIRDIPERKWDFNPTKK